VRALLRLTTMRGMLRFAPFHRVRRFIDSRPRGTAPTDPRAAALTVRRAVSRAERTLPASTCLARSLAAEWMLREQGLGAKLSIGVARAAPGAALPLDAHAWIESQGLIIAGDGELDRYAALVSFGSPP
jgi:hypothetical protein